MPDSLAERLKRLADAQANEQKAEDDVKAFQARVNQFISDHARGEFAKLQDQLKSQSEAVNPHLGDDLPKFQWNGGSQFVQQGNFVAGIHFEKPISNSPANRLTISIGPNPFGMYAPWFRPPKPIVRRLQAAATNELDGIVWTGDFGEVTTEELVGIILESLTAYYLENKPKH
jgi:hypothetical protein